MNFIYGLFEKGENKIKYIGKTNNIERRLKQHIRESVKNKTEKQKWIYSVIKRNSEIDIKILKIVDNKWQIHEIELIEKYKDLTNISKGGYGGRNIHYDISYNECKKYIQEHYNLKSKKEWLNYEYIDKFIPKNPRESYLNRGWISWGDFLGTGKIQDNKLSEKYISYNDAKIYIKENLYKLDTIKKWKENIQLIPYNIPNRPDRYYKNRGWISWGDFLGTGKIANQNKNFVTYEECKNFALVNNISSRKDWNNIKLPQNIPSNPDKNYKEWISWGDFLDTGRIQSNKLSENYLNYNDSKKYIKKYNITSSYRWHKYIKENTVPYFIPNHPEIYYNNKNRGWLGWKDFLYN